MRGELGGLRAESDGPEELAERPHVFENQLFRESLHGAPDDAWLSMLEVPFGAGAYDGFDELEPMPSTPK